MARVTIARRWPDGDSLTIVIRADNTFPEALAQAKLIALDAFAEACDVCLLPAVDEPAATPEAD